MAALEAAAVKAIADEAAKLAAEAAAGEIEQLIAVKLAELATPEGFRALALKAAAGEAGSLATKTVKNKVQAKNDLCSIYTCLFRKNQSRPLGC